MFGLKGPILYLTAFGAVDLIITMATCTFRQVDVDWAVERTLVSSVWNDYSLSSKELYKLIVRDYDFCSSLVDFCLSCFVRIIVIINGLNIAVNKKSSAAGSANRMLVVVLVAMLSWAFSLSKLLAFSEIPDGLKLVKFWILFSWNALASILLVILWKLVVCGWKSQSDGAFPKKPTESRKDNGAKNVLSNLDSQSYASFLRLLQYCKAEWTWYILGFSFSAIYTGGLCALLL